MNGIYAPTNSSKFYYMKKFAEIIEDIFITPLSLTYSILNTDWDNFFLKYFDKDVVYDHLMLY